VSRREFVASTAVGIAAAAASDIPYPMRPPRPLPPSSRWAAKPVALSSANGPRAAQQAIDMGMHGADTRDALIEGGKTQDLNPDDDFLDVPEAEHMVVRPTGTINCDAVTPQGDISSVTTTSGVALKILGRVGDSAIVGAGQYTDNDVGAAGSTGRGESNIKVCG